MNLWYISALIIIGLGIVILISCFLGSIFAIKKILIVLNSSAQRIQNEIQPIQNQVQILNSKVNRLVADMERKKSDLVNITDGVKHLVRNIDQLTKTSYVSSKKMVDKINNDPKISAETEQLTELALHYLKRKA